jgi:hypothetical protein
MVQHLTSRLHAFLPWDWNRSIFRRTRLLGGVHSVNLEKLHTKTMDSRLAYIVTLAL